MRVPGVFDSAELAEWQEYLDSLLEERTDMATCGSKKKKMMDDEEEMMDSEELETEDLETEELTEADYEAAEADDEEDEEEDDEDNYDSEDVDGKIKEAFDAMMERIDALESFNAELGAQNTVYERLVGEHSDSDAFELAVQERLDSIFEAYEDAQDYLPEDFKLDGSCTPASIQKAAVEAFWSAQSDIYTDSEDEEDDLNLDSDEAIFGAYKAMKKAYRRGDGVRKLDSALSEAMVAPKLDGYSNYVSELENAWRAK
jgi:hypothetical protein